MAQTILIADDEPSIIEVLQYNLEKAGYEVVAAADGLEALRAAFRQTPDLAVLDITMPGMDGLELCGRLRLEKNIPVILLTARDSEIDKIVGLEIGADDYVTKPFSPRELLARVKAVLRRAKTAGDVPAAGKLEIGPLYLDTLRHEVRLQGKPVTLTAKEFCLLEYLMRNAGIALTRHAILDHVWGYDFYGDVRTVDVHIRRLREKVEPAAAAPSLILTVPGVGYKFATEAS
jgi:DNA-binding response OmpR family regulator